MPYKPNERQYRKCGAFEARAAEGAEPSFTVVGYATTFDEPYVLWQDEKGTEYYEVVDRHALDNADMTDVIMQFDHSGRVFARQSNGTLVIEPDEHGMKITADLSTNEMTRALYDDIRTGLITKMSWGFLPSEMHYDKAKRTQYITRVARVFDVSAVSIPADQDTEISVRKLIDGVIKPAEEECLKRAAEIERRKAKLRIMLSIGGKTK